MSTQRPTRRPATFSDRTLLMIGLSLFALGEACSILDSPQWLDNLLRAAVLGMGILIIAISLVIVRVYYRNFKAAPERARLLPRHVVQLGLMVVLIVFATVVVTIDKVSTHLVWYGIPILLPAYFIGVAGLMDMVRWLPDRRHRPHPTGEE